jgi:anti-sigma-K factor RskA
VRLALPGDAALRDAVAGWEARLAPLTVLAPPETPPDLWPRIEASLEERAQGVVVPLRAVPHSSGPQSSGPPSSGLQRSGPRAMPWRGWAIGSTAVAAGLAALLLTRPPAPAPGLMTVLLSSADQPAWLVQAEGESIRLASVNPRPVEAGRVTQLWALPQGATAPISLGLIPPEGRFTVAPARFVPRRAC